MGAGGNAVVFGDNGAGLNALMAGRDTRWYVGNKLKLSLMILVILIASMTNGYDGSMMNGLQAVDNWKVYFDNPQDKPTLFGVYNAIQNIGGIVGLPFAPYFSDIFGRRFGIFFGCTLMLIATAIQTSAQNVGMFLGARFLIGFGLSFVAVAAPVLVTELAFPTHRAPATALYNTCWYFGSIVAAWTTYGTFRIQNTWSWRIPSLLMGLPSIIQFTMIWFIPESPRWLVHKGKDEQARKVIVKYHCEDNEEDPLVSFEMEEIKKTLALEAQANSSSSWKELFTTKGNLRRLRIIVAIAFFSQWSGNGLVSYYLTLLLNGIGIKSQSDQTLINGVLQIWNYITSVAAALVVERVGRRPLFLVSTIGMCVSFICWTICSATYTKSSTEFDPQCVLDNMGKTANCVALNANKAAGHAVIAFIFLFNTFYNIALNPLLVSYSIEILPFRVRSKGVMVTQLTVSAAIVFNQYVNPIALDAIGWKYYIVFCVFLAFEVVYCWLYAFETRGPNGPLPLEEIAQIFEGPSRFAFQKRPNQHFDNESSDETQSHNDEKVPDQFDERK